MEIFWKRLILFGKGRNIFGKVSNFSKVRLKHFQGGGGVCRVKKISVRKELRFSRLGLKYLYRGN